MAKLPKHRRIPRGKGYDKANIGKLLKKAPEFKGDFFKYCRSIKLKPDWFARSAEEHFPEEWAKYIHEDGSRQIPCEYCKTPFYPSKKDNTFCSTYCSRNNKTDKEYFGGRRQEGRGVKEMMCQLCQQPIESNMQAHHVYGKLKDTEDEWLVALHSGCHQIIEKLSIMKFADDTTVLEKLLEFVWKKRHGWDSPDNEVIVTVKIEVI